MYYSNKDHTNLFKIVRKNDYELTISSYDFKGEFKQMDKSSLDSFESIPSKKNAKKNI